MNRVELQEISRQRVREARLLLDNGLYPGAYYLLGYSVECAFKACIAKQIRKHDFPDRRLIDDSYTHDLAKLLINSGLKIELQREFTSNPLLEVNWAIVKDWSQNSRYDNGISKTKAKDLYAAILSRKNGVLTWLKKWW
jgi:hypothetical protein